MRYLLDTNACVDYLNGRYPAVTRRVQQAVPEDLCVSSVAVAELRYGAEKSTRPRENHARLDVLFGEIAAHGVSLGLVVVTDNVREFRRVKGLKVENWRR